MQKRNGLGPVVVLTFIYFIVGFLTTVNGQFQGPLKIAFLSHADELRNTLTTLISFFFFLGYLLLCRMRRKIESVNLVHHGFGFALFKYIFDTEFHILKPDSDISRSHSVSSRKFHINLVTFNVSILLSPFPKNSYTIFKLFSKSDSFHE